MLLIINDNSCTFYHNKKNAIVILKLYKMYYLTTCIIINISYIVRNKLK